MQVNSLQELVRALRARPGVDAVVAVGRDGLVIDALTNSAFEPDQLAAVVPLVVASGDDLGAQAHHGRLAIQVLEYDSGAALVLPLGGDVSLLVLTSLADVAPLLYELRRNRRRLSTLA